MTEADILALTYDDTFTLYRPIKDTLPNGESVFKNGLEGNIVYTDMPCALSSPSGGKAMRNGISVDVNVEYELFYRPEIAILASDTVVIKHLGQSIVVVAGLAKRYVSHNCLPISKEDIA